MKARRAFLKSMLGGIGGAAMLPYLANAGRAAVYTTASVNNTALFSVHNPYAGIQWDKIEYVPSATHVHVENQSKLDKVYNHFGLRHIPISNYYPAAPYYPAKEMRENHFRAKQNFGVVYNPDSTGKGKERWTNGKYIEGPLDWNAIIMDKRTGWLNDLPKDLQEKLPFKQGDYLYKNIPADVIISPNAEHSHFTNSSLHACAVGSLYASGNFDVRNYYKTADHGYAGGTSVTWQVAFKGMIEKLLFKDAGGVTVNHPTWSSLTFEEVIKMLDFDARVLGIEVYNDTCATNYGEPERGWALKLWDDVLKTNRRCFGFFVPDHTLGRGRNILLVSKFTEYDCLRAYRMGAFFGALNGNSLKFSNIELSKTELKVELNKRASIRIVTNNGEAQKTNGDQAVFTIPVDSNGVPAISYVRVEAIDEYSEQIFSQAIRFLK